MSTATFHLLVLLTPVALIVLLFVGLVWKLRLDASRVPIKFYAPHSTPEPPLQAEFLEDMALNGVVKFGSFHYANTGVRITRSGIHVSIFSLAFSLPLLLLPWSGVKSMVEKRGSFSRQVHVRFADEAQGWKMFLTISLPLERDLPEWFSAG